MSRRPLRLAVALGLWAACFGLGLVSPALAQGAAPISYRLSFPEPHHRYIEVQVDFPDLPPEPLRVRMSRSSPGRYALHEFAKNVFEFRAADGAGRMLEADRPDVHSWRLAGHDGTVQVTYRLYGDQVDGTYLAIDSTHAHLNMPATLMWAEGLEERSVRVTFVRPAGTSWNVATQLHETEAPLVYTAPNLQYLMDSPTEFGDFEVRAATVSLDGAAETPGLVPAAPIRLALHHEPARASDSDMDVFFDGIVRLVREEGAVFGGYPRFDVGRYTFLADYLPQASEDGMEHRNSTVLTSSGSLGSAGQRAQLLGTVAHEFFHTWNVERIRPAALEPFDFTEANPSGELWLAEGFTSYYQILLMQRAGIASVDQTIADFGQAVDRVVNSPGRLLRSAVEMSRLAPFVDAARWADRTDWNNVYISYYTWGTALGLGLDLALRDRTGGRVTLDDFMRTMWREHGSPPGRAEGYVGAPYTLADARARLAEVSGDASFADDFFDRFVEGREAMDYRRLAARAGLAFRPRNPGRAWIGDVRLTGAGPVVHLAAPPPLGSPLYRAGITQDDQILTVDSESIDSPSRLAAVLGRHQPGDRVSVVFTRRGVRTTGVLALEEDPGLELVPVERTGRTATPAELAFRQAWLGSRQ